MFNWMNMMFDYEDRKVDRYENDNLVIDTCEVTDNPEYPFETAIKHPDYNDNKFIIVEQYVDKELAKSGHDKWVDIMINNPPLSLKDVSTCDIALITKSFYDSDLDYDNKHVFNKKNNN